MIGRAERRRRVVIRRGARHGGATRRVFFELDVVVEDDRFVGVDVPHACVGDLRNEAGCGQCMIERAGLAIEHVGIAVVVELDQSARAQDVNRVLFRVSVEVTDDEHVGIICHRLHRRDE